MLDKNILSLPSNNIPLPEEDMEYINLLFPLQEKKNKFDINHILPYIILFSIIFSISLLFSIPLVTNFIDKLLSIFTKNDSPIIKSIIRSIFISLFILISISYIKKKK